MNEYINAQQASEKWNISDRRVRVLCREGKIPGAVKYGKSYKIPVESVKPADGRKAPMYAGTRFLKWDNTVVGTIDSANAITFIRPDYNGVVALYTRGAKSWTPDQFTEFLSERMISRDRRDIEKILFRCGLSHYDVLRIAEITRGIHPRDLIWIADSENENLGDVITNVFESVFHQKTDLTGDSIDTPEGYNIKRYGAYNGQYGCARRRKTGPKSAVEN